MTIDSIDTTCFHVTMDDFDHFDPWPTNWEEISDFLNRIIDSRIAEALADIGEDDFDSSIKVDLIDISENVWEQYCSGEFDDKGCPAIVPAPKQISLDNGFTYLDAHEAIESLQKRAEEDEVPFSRLWNVVVQFMDDDTREAVHAELAPCTEEEFLKRYLELAPDNIVIG